MARLSRQILAEIENIEVALSNLDQALARERKSVVELAAMGTFLNNFYNGIENILKQIMRSRKIALRASSGWHKELLKASASEGIISAQLADSLYPYLSFRHYFIHGYGFMLDETELTTLARNVPATWSQFMSEIQALI